MYQLYQYITNKRFFFFGNGKDKNVISNGNNIWHTLYKLSEYLIGFIILWLLDYFGLFSKESCQNS